MSNAILTYTDLRKKINKGFLSGPWGEKWQTVLGNQLDIEDSKGEWARRCRWPDWCPSDGLEYIGKERRLERVVIFGSSLVEEAEADYRHRLKTAWLIWKKAGSQPAHQMWLGWCGIKNAQVYRRKDWMWPDDNASSSLYVKSFARSVWSQFDIFIGQPLPWQGLVWGQANLNWGMYTWGSTALPEEVSFVKRLARKFASGQNTPMYAVLNLGGGSVWGVGFWGSGTWGNGPLGTIKWLIGEDHWSTRGLL